MAKEKGKKPVKPQPRPDVKKVFKRRTEGANRKPPPDGQKR